MSHALSLVTSGKSPALVRASRLDKRGVSRSSQNVGRGMRWTLLVRETNAATGGRRSRVVLTPRRWRQVVDNAAHCDDDGDNKPGSPGRARRKPLKPFARGMPGRFRRTYGDDLRVFFSRMLRVRTMRPAFPAPSHEEGRYFENSGEHSVARMPSYGPLSS